MKLRFRDNGLRLRVNRLEVEGLASGAALAEQVHFPGDSTISYVLESSEHSSPQASFLHGVIRVAAPRKLVRDWANSDSVGMYFELPVSGAVLKIAIEKDLECLDGPVNERDPHAFARPGISKKC